MESPALRRANAERSAVQAGWHVLPVTTPDFVFTAYVPAATQAIAELTVYIEGDGFAWRTPQQPSNDPSPRNPVALQLALRHPDSAAAWLGRPCQFTQRADWRSCAARYWTNERFSEAVVAASDQAISELKRRRGAQHIVLVGYSGGGAIALLVAARRVDVQRVITVAGNLDHAQWTRWHQVPPLDGSLNAADFSAALATIPQTHWVGGRDTVVSRNVADAYAARFPAQQRPLIREIVDADHAHGWVERWPALLLESSH